jgi:uncharacterized damage-inducible protein DinB
LRLPPDPAVDCPPARAAESQFQPRRWFHACCRPKEEATMTQTIAQPSPKQQYLDAYEREHVTTMRVLRAYPEGRLDLRPQAMCKTARELAWVFAMERRFGTNLMNNAFASGMPPGTPPPPPESWSELLAAIETAHRDYGELVRGLSEPALFETVRFFTAPKTMGDVQRIQILWTLLCDQIHHRGQFSIYLRMAGGKVPSIYGPTADEPWT